MTTPSEEIVGRYAKVVRVSDRLGRVIGVKRLKLSQQLKVSEMTPGLEGDTHIEQEDGGLLKIPKRTIPLLAASVCEINEVPVPFPKTRGELDSILDRLDDEGLAAVMEAFGKMNVVKTPDEEAEDPIEAAKK